MRVALALVALLAAACAAVAPGPSPASATPDIVAEVGQLFEARRNAIGTRDLAAFERTYDAGRASFADCQREQYDLGAGPSPLGLDRVDLYGSYVRVIAHFPGGAVRYFARRIDGVLRLTEPQPNEVGESRTRTDGPITVRYWAIDEDVSEGVAIQAHHAYDFAAAEAPTPPQFPFSVQLYPVHSFMSGSPCWIAGTASLSNRSQPTVSLPVYNNSFDSAFKAPTVGTYDTLSHEALHWIQGQVAFDSVAVAPWWLLEGWPDRVAQIDRSVIVRRLLCTSAFPSRDALERHGIALLERPGSLDAAGQYAAANSMVDYLFTTYGRQRYWELFSGAATYIDNERAFRGVLGIGQADYYDAWLRWVKTKYC